MFECCIEKLFITDIQTSLSFFAPILPPTDTIKILESGILNSLLACFLFIETKLLRKGLPVKCAFLYFRPSGFAPRSKRLHFLASNFEDNPNTAFDS